MGHVPNDNDPAAVLKAGNSVVVNTGFVDGQGNEGDFANYKWKDINPADGVHYYRLKPIDFNRFNVFSKIISINFNSESEIRVYPNPFNN